MQHKIESWYPNAVTNYNLITDITNTMANSTAAFILGCLMFLALIAIVIFGATAIDDSIVMIITFIAAGCLTIIFIFVCIVGIVKLCRMLIAGDDKNEETV